MKFSVIMPVYNVEKYIEKSIKSVLSQSYKDIELIIINDGSLDNSEKIIKKYMLRDDRIKYVKKMNTGLSDTRNVGVKLVSGDYLYFLDSDDYLDSDFFYKISKKIKGLDLLRIGYRKVDIDGNIICEEKAPKFDKLNGFDAFIELVNNGQLVESASLFIYNTDYYKNNKYKFKVGSYHEDFGLLPEVLIKANNVSSLDVCFNYLVRPDSIMTTKDYKKITKKAYDILEHYNYLKDVIDKMDVSSRRHDAFIYYIENAVVAKLYEFKDNKIEYKKFLSIIKNSDIFKYTCKSNYKYIIKKTILRISPKFYLKRILKIDKWYK